MSAVTFGANVLAEVREESFDEVLRDLRYAIEPEPRCRLGVPQLDHVLDLFRFPHGPIGGQEVHDLIHSDQSYQDDSPSARVTGTLEFLEGRNVKTKSATIEIGHSASSTGKTNLLYHITAATILPKSQNGKEGAVVWLDTDMSFSARRLHQICVNFLNRLDKPSLTPPAIETTVEEALQHVHVFSITSSKQLLTILDNLEIYLLQSHKPTSSRPDHHHSFHHPLSLIILDSATSFHWPDRFESEIARLETIRPPGSTTATTTSIILPPPKTPSSPTSLIISSLQTLQTKFDCSCIYTTTTTTTTPQPHAIRTSNSTATADSSPFRPLEDDTPAHSPWTLSATLSLTLTRIPVPRFASDMGLDQCLRDRAKRQEVVGANRIRVGVNEEWLSKVVRDKGVRDAVGRLDARGAFVMSVGSRGIDIE